MADFVMTIESDDEGEDQVIHADDDVEEGDAEKFSALNTKFEFDDGSLSFGKKGHEWDLTRALAQLHKPASTATSLQKRIDNKRTQLGLDKEDGLAWDPLQAEADQGDKGFMADNSAKEGDRAAQKKKRKRKKDDKADEDELDPMGLTEADKERAHLYFEQDEDGIKTHLDAEDLPQSFSELNLSRPLVRAVEKMGFSAPTEIQKRAIPVALMGKDVCASAQTGAGKTAAFLLPVLERLLFRAKNQAVTRVLVIQPTRELAKQSSDQLAALGAFTNITSALVVGGEPLKAQEVELRRCPDVVFCTPGRMIDHLRNSVSVHFDGLEILILDEADRLLELGFTEEVEELVRLCPVGRQTMLFSATMTEKVDQLVKLSLKKPVRIVADRHFSTSSKLVQEFVKIREHNEEDREAILLALCSRAFRTKTVVFFETKVACHRAAILFGLAGLSVGELHGNLTQQMRNEALEKFKQGHVDILVCTDLAARGLDIHNVQAVINYEMPKDLTTYIHRVGRTARAGRAGRSITLCGEGRRTIMKQVIRNHAGKTTGDDGDDATKQVPRGTLKSRSVPPNVIDQWRTKIADMAEAIEEIYEEEKTEKMLRVATMEANKASNLVNYADDISSR
jgi:ATP-dependent RNA helicase DDX27